MRIVAGKLGGRRLPRLSADGVRPTSERVREAIFSSLQALTRVEEARVLDLYAGSGALGFEALSRGASRCCFVEQQRKVCRTLQQAAEVFGVTKDVEVIERDALAFLRRPSTGGAGAFHLVFADPPYESIQAAELLDAVLSSSVVGAGTIFVLETGKKHAVPAGGFAEAQQLSAVVKRAKTYGDTAVTYFEFQ
ncbi:MAG: 16S rRNA (guanine(966)-N(2))-methyltransferase RsmD [Bdellovibrionales bacterium]|nr:16S rRNA (guanine(966)-N(2))-methyltransferase RsmD [Bdellovibrionales bacterium]